MFLLDAPLASGYHRDFQLDKRMVFGGIASLQECLGVMLLYVKSLKVDGGKCAAACTPEIFSADEAVRLAKEGVPFRQAYLQARASPLARGLSNGGLGQSLASRKTIGSAGNLQLAALGRQVAVEERFFKAVVAQRELRALL